MPLQIAQGVNETTAQRRHFMIISSPDTDVRSVAIGNWLRRENECRIASERQTILGRVTQMCFAVVSSTN